MDKLIKKVAIITCLTLVALTLVGVFCIFTFAPKFAGDKCFELGLKDLATSCYEREYQNTGEFEDLVTLVDHAIFVEDDKLIIDYGEKMIDRNNEFLSYCGEVDGQDQLVELSTYDYYVTTVMMAYYESGNKDKAVSIAFSKLTDRGYAEGCALYYAVQIAREDKEMLEKLVDGYKGLDRKTFTGYTVFKTDLRSIDPEIKI